MLNFMLLNFCQLYFVIKYIFANQKCNMKYTAIISTNYIALQILLVVAIKKMNTSFYI